MQYKETKEIFEWKQVNERASEWLNDWNIVFINGVLQIIVLMLSPMWSIQQDSFTMYLSFFKILFAKLENRELAISPEEISELNVWKTAR